MLKDKSFSFILLSKIELLDNAEAYVTLINLAVPMSYYVHNCHFISNRFATSFDLHRTQDSSCYYIMTVA